MAVFTSVTSAELQHWLTQYAVNQAGHSVLQLEGISSGIENTNYFVTTETGQFVLTLFEKLTAEQLPFYLNLMHHLAQQDIPVAAPVPQANGQLFSMLHQKPAALVRRLAGHSCLQPTAQHCVLVGKTLADMHLAARNFTGAQPNLRGLAWWQATAPTVLPYLPNEIAPLLAEEISAQTEFAQTPEYLALPRSAVHADLFRDNVLFDEQGGQLRMGGCIDFYFAGVDTWLFDLAVTVNDWCIDHQTGALDVVLTHSLIQAYAQVRNFTEAERSPTAWPMMLRAAALRFWMSRLYDFYLPRPAEMVTPKDPTHFERVLRMRRSAQITPLP